MSRLNAAGRRAAAALTPDPSPHGPRSVAPNRPLCGPVERGGLPLLDSASGAGTAAYFTPSPPGRTAVGESPACGARVERGPGGEGRAPPAPDSAPNPVHFIVGMSRAPHPDIAPPSASRSETP